MRAETREALELFVEKADELMVSSFVRSLVEHGTQVTISWTAEEPVLKIERSGPQQESIAAFVLTFRFFVVANEASSFRSLSQKVLDDPGLSENWKRNFAEAREDWNNYLDSSVTWLSLNGQHPVRRNILFTFLYGGLAHANVAVTRQKFKLWQADPVFFPFAADEFQQVLMNPLDVIAQISQLSEHELRN